MNDDRNRELIEMYNQVRAKCGTGRLTDEELLLLACEEISRTTTYRELGYFQTGR